MQFRTVFGTDSSLAVGMTLLVTIDGAVSCHPEQPLFCHPERSRRRSGGSGIPHRVSALVSPSGADPLLRSLRQGAGAQDDREGILFQLLRFAQDDREQILQDDSVYCAISFGFPALGA